MNVPEPAFPSDIDPGMSLRDWFAGQALTALLGDTSVEWDASGERLARFAYKMADAMIKAREQKP